jgi:hypothetical protein
MHPRHLARRAPPAAWEAYLLVGIFPAAARLRWCKAHVFVGRTRPGRHCLSAMEALDGPGEAVVIVADASGANRHVRALNEATCVRAADTWRIEAPGLAWSGYPDTRLTVDEPRILATATVQEVGWWARVPRVLSYFSGMGELVWTDVGGTARGVALVEHAWGADAPVDIAALAPRRWQWDVLSTEDGA